MFQYNTVEEALEALRKGEIILVTDDEERENEGDMICAAQYATTENVNFMAMHAKGLICMPMSIDLCRRLHLPHVYFKCAILSDMHKSRENGYEGNKGLTTLLKFRIIQNRQNV